VFGSTLMPCIFIVHPELLAAVESRLVTHGWLRAQKNLCRERSAEGAGDADGAWVIVEVQREAVISAAGMFTSDGGEEFKKNVPLRLPRRRPVTEGAKSGTGGVSSDSWRKSSKMAYRHLFPLRSRR
jgi:hypothetical protein